MVKPSQVKKKSKSYQWTFIHPVACHAFGGTPVFLTAHVQQGIVILITNIYLEPKCHCSNNLLLINKITEKVD